MMFLIFLSSSGTCPFHLSPASSTSYPPPSHKLRAWPLVPHHPSSPPVQGPAAPGSVPASGD
eukprot:748911-Hanusia_phi.AAC.1